MAAKWAQHEVRSSDAAGRLFLHCAAADSGRCAGEARRQAARLPPGDQRGARRLAASHVTHICAGRAGLPLSRVAHATQVLKAVGGSLSDFRVGLCNVFCAPRAAPARLRLCVVAACPRRSPWRARRSAAHVRVAVRPRAAAWPAAAVDAREASLSSHRWACLAQDDQRELRPRRADRHGDLAQPLGAGGEAGALGAHRGGPRRHARCALPSLCAAAARPRRRLSTPRAARSARQVVHFWLLAEHPHHRRQAQPRHLAGAGA